MITSKKYDVVIVGGGVTGTALLYLLSQYTDLKNLALIEKASLLASINSHGRNNSQTLHCGDIETNYSLEKALKVRDGAMMISRYVRNLPDAADILYRYPKMVLAVGDAECELLQKRYSLFKPHFSNLSLWENQAIAQLEPNVVHGRHERVVAMGVENDYSAVNFQALASSFVTQASALPGKNVDVFLDTKLKKVTEQDQGFVLNTTQGEIQACFVVVSAGAHSLLLARSLGYGKQYACMPVAGSFYYTPDVLKGKVYTMQNDKLPFAAIHGDPDLLVRGKTRFGPTALLLPLLEKGKWRTLPEFLKVFRPDRVVIKVMWNLLRDRDIRRYLIRNLMYEIPLVRRRLFLKDVRKIIPSMQLHDLRFARGIGGIRPVMIDKSKQALLLGEAKITTENGLIFNMTPSPGATSCLQNAELDLQVIGKHLQCNIDNRQLELDLQTD